MTFHLSHPFEELLFQVYHHGEVRTSRTGLGTRSLFAPDPLRFDLTNAKVPLITSKQVPWRMALREFMWMLSGSTNVFDLAESSPAMARIWMNWANADGEIGPTYGAQYRDAGGTLLQSAVSQSVNEPWADLRVSAGVDQLRHVITQLSGFPDTRRAVISLWSAPELSAMQLEPCMVLFQFSLRGDAYDKLDLHVYQRSADMMLGVPFDLFQAGVFAHLVARELTAITGRLITANQLTWSAGDVHLYENQLEPAKLQLAQYAQAEPMRATIVIDPFATLRLLDGTLEPGHIRIQNYNPQPAIDGGAVAV